MFAYRFPNFCSRGPTATVHDEVEGLLLRALQLLPRKVLVPFQQVRGQHHVAGLIGRVFVTKEFELKIGEQSCPPYRRRGRFQKLQRWRTWG